MKILLVGASGTIGKAVEAAIVKDHEIVYEVVTANYSSGDVQVDLGNPRSIQVMFDKVGKIDAIICTAGLVNFSPFTELGDTDYTQALENKLMGQINLVRFGSSSLNSGGSIILTSGVLSREPMQGSTVISMANGALESFVKAAALELDTFRLNVVAPIFVKETMAMMGMDTAAGLSAENTANAYLAALTGTMHGETLDVSNYQ